MELSIVILNYKSKELVRQCISKAVESGLPFDYEIIVVDNDSGDGCLEAVQGEFPDVIAIQTGENKGYSAGNNIGIRAARGKYVLVMNPDIIPKPGSIEKMHRFMEDRPQCGLCGPKLLNIDGSVQMSARTFPDWRMPLYRRTFLGRFRFARNYLKKFLMEEWDHKETREVDWMLGACLMARKDAIGRVGLLDEEKFFLYFEDVDWCRRFWEEGFKVYYLADAEMVHYHQQISARRKGLKALISPSARIHIRSGMRYFFKYRFRRRPARGLNAQREQNEK